MSDVKPDTDSELDEWLGQERPSPVRMTPEEEAEQHAHYLARVREWRKGSVWAAREAQLYDDRSFLSVTSFARLTGVSRSTVDRWRRADRVVALPTGRGHRYPRDQLDEANQLPRGLDQVIGILGNGYLTWLWLGRTRYSLRGISPLEALRAGTRQAVMDDAIATANGAIF